MKRSKSRSCTTSAPVAEIAADLDYAGGQLLALMAWPKSLRQRQQVLATFGADMFGGLEKHAREAQRMGVQAAFSEMINVAGTNPDHLPFLPCTAAAMKEIFAAPHAVALAVRRDLWEPSGGFKSVADAPGSEAVVRQFAAACGGGAAMAGVLLMLVSVIRAVHPNVQPSLARAMAIVSARERTPGFRVPDQRTLKAWWKEWRGIAPVWAAFALHCELSNVPREAAGWEATFNPKHRRQILAWAKWFRRFGTTFVPQNGSGPLIPPGEAVNIQCDVDEEEPPLGKCGIRPADLEAATSGTGGRYRWNILDRD